MPPKIRELIAELERNGYVERRGKGSHRVYRHPFSSKKIVISGKFGSDAKRYQIEQVREAIDELKRK